MNNDTLKHTTASTRSSKAVRQLAELLLREKEAMLLISVDI